MMIKHRGCVQLRVGNKKGQVWVMDGEKALACNGGGLLPNTGQAWVMNGDKAPVCTVVGCKGTQGQVWDAGHRR